jgi:16S rRNA (cytosine967-C5)-methyltransferase
MRFHAHVNTSVRLLSDYHGHLPFAKWLKDFFKANKKFGSKDRRMISSLCYGYFRLGKNDTNFSPEKAVAIGYALQAPYPDDLLQYYLPEYCEWLFAHPHAGLQEKADYFHLDTSKIFTWQHEVSERIDKKAFSFSHLVQPNVYLRIRPQQLQNVLEKLPAIPEAKLIDKDILQLPPAFKVEEYFELNTEVVVQDICSQKVSCLFPALPESPKIWDACAGSGGKSIMAADYYGKVKLTVSDVRQTILHNLKNRFRYAGLKAVHGFVADLEQVVPLNDHYDFIIADVPCSGSGTWGRTPEQLLFFDKDKISSFSHRQKKITCNLLPSLTPGGYLLYITCSVFTEENESVIAHLLHAGNLELVKDMYLEGYNLRGDSLYGALLRRI